MSSKRSLEICSVADLLSRKGRKKGAEATMAGSILVKWGLFVPYEVSGSEYFYS